MSIRGRRSAIIGIVGCVALGVVVYVVFFLLVSSAVTA